jgi:hypothetical protein
MSVIDPGARLQVNVERVDGEKVNIEKTFLGDRKDRHWMLA